MKRFLTVTLEAGYVEPITSYRLLNQIVSEKIFSRDSL